MKTKIATLITLLILTVSITIASAATKADETTVLTVTKNINKIEASGNVEVYITNGDKDEVKVYDNYYTHNALVQDEDGVLRISSYKADKLVVLVTVTDLQSVIASDHASIKSLGTLAAINLNVTLNNNASAQLKLDAFAANITVNDRATADLTGNINDYNLNYSQSSTVNRTELATINSDEKNTTKKAAHHNFNYRMASL